MRTSRLILTALLIFSAFLLATWGAGGFILWNWNPQQWSADSRFLFVLAAFVEAAGTAGIASDLTRGKR